jgi:hypothetical protein
MANALAFPQQQHAEKKSNVMSTTRNLRHIRRRRRSQPTSTNHGEPTSSDTGEGVAFSRDSIPKRRKKIRPSDGIGADDDSKVTDTGSTPKVTRIPIHGSSTAVSDTDLDDTSSTTAPTSTTTKPAFNINPGVSFMFPFSSTGGHAAPMNPFGPVSPIAPANPTPVPTTSNLNPIPSSSEEFK